jgi:hypothetical protein
MGGGALEGGARGGILPMKKRKEQEGEESMARRCIALIALF